MSGRPSDGAAVATAHRHLSTSPESGFVRRLVAQRRDTSGVDTVRGCLLTRTEPTAQTERELTTFDDWRAALTDVAGLPLDGVAEQDLRGLFDRMLTDHRAWLTAGRP